MKLLPSNLLLSRMKVFNISVLQYFCLTTLCTPFRYLDDDCSAGRSYRCVWRALSRHPNRYATCERRNDAKASSEDAVVDVEVDPCIDENSASNLNYSPSFTEAPSIKTFVERCVPIFLPPGRDESSLSQFFPTRILKRKRATR